VCCDRAGNGRIWQLTSLPLSLPLFLPSRKSVTPTLARQLGRRRQRGLCRCGKTQPGLEDSQFGEADGGSSSSFFRAPVQHLRATPSRTAFSSTDRATHRGCAVAGDSEGHRFPQPRGWGGDFALGCREQNELPVDVSGFVPGRLSSCQTPCAGPSRQRHRLSPGPVGGLPSPGGRHGATGPTQGMGGQRCSARPRRHTSYSEAPRRHSGSRRGDVHTTCHFTFIFFLIAHECWFSPHYEHIF
jgi:hypothetical protein